MFIDGPLDAVSTPADDRDNAGTLCLCANPRHQEKQDDSLNPNQPPYMFHDALLRKYPSDKKMPRFIH
jgi:hypothetical protein